ncbi:MAG: RIP metalloprotease RseP [Spirochaetia bacterium]|nr:MAG: RIP metalloprotease RseP [Spirochaetia bacterium]
MLLGIIFVIIFLSVLILVHELGHFLTAKKFGLLVEEFGFGLPPKIWGKKIGETIYSINALPFGGFVKIYGENRDESENDNPNLQINPNTPNEIKIIESELSYKLTGLFFETHKQIGRFAREKQHGDFLENLFKQNEINYKREVPISIGGSNSNIVDFIVEDKIIIELKSKPFIGKSDYYQTKRYLDAANLELGLIVNFRETYLKPKRVLNYKDGVVGEDSKQFVDLNEIRSFGLLSIWKRAVILVSGVLMNFLFGWLVISVILSLGVPQSVVISEIFKGTPAETAGLKVGDAILGMSTNDFIKFTNDNKGKEIIVKVERDGVEKEIKATPRTNPPAGEGALGIGLFESGAPSQNFFLALWDGMKMSVEIVRMIFIALFNLIVGVFSGGKVGLEQVSGPVGIVKITAQASGLGIVYLLQLLALISFNLAVINIFPFPALDGGRLFFLLIEKIKGSPLPAKFENYANAAGMALLLILMVVITIRDIVRF